MRVLALDLATNFGWASGSLQEGVIESGSYRLPKTGDDVGLFLAYFRKWLDSGITRLEPREIIFESPVIFDPRKTTPITVRKLNALAAQAELVAHDRSIPCAEANVADVRTHALGKGNVPRKGEIVKRAVMMWCRNRGWNPRDDDEADALALLDFALCAKKPSHALKATPLFRGIPV